MLLNDVYDYKNQLIEDMMTDEEIVNLIRPGTSLEDAKDLIYTQVFPFDYVPDTTEEAKTYVCCEVNVKKSLGSKTYYAPTIYIWTFTHKSLMRLPEGGTRIDRICSRVNELINGSYMYGLGKLDFMTASHFSLMMDYNGKFMTFEATEFNNLSPTRQPIPSNRKDPTR